jgi:uncharacterized protein YjbJ (UPF0337 family)
MELTMEWDQLESNWKEFEGSARAHWSQLTNDDWQKIDGKRAQLVERIQAAYGVSKAASETQVGDWSEALLKTPAVAKPR